jgi:outer membrane autotransporter protein
MDSSGRAPGANQTLKHAAWMEGFGQWADQDADDGFTGFEYDVAGAAFGLDHLFDDGVLAGISYARANTNIDLDDDKGSGDIDSDFISLYGSLFSDKMYLDGALSYANQSYDNKRVIQVGDITSVARSDHDGDSYAAYAEAGYNYEYEKWILQPFGSLQYTYLDEDSFTEYGADGVNLLVKDRQTDSLVSQLGTRFYHPFKSESWDWIPELTLAWRHDFDIDDRQMTAAFDSAPGVAFTTDSRDVDQDGVVIGTGMTLLNRAGLSLYLKYSSEFRSDYKAHVLYGGLRYEF